MRLDLERTVKKDKRFEINLVRLENKTHDFKYEIDADFFGGLEQDLLEKGRVTVEVKMDKREALVEMDMKFSGDVELVCDRSLKTFDYPMNFETRFFLKFGDTHKELDDNMIQVSYDDPVIDLSGLIFELLALRIPVKKIHPDHVSEEDDQEGGEEEKLFFTTGEEREESRSEEPVDPRWSELLKLKNKNN